MYYLTKAAVPHMKPGSCIINIASINSNQPNPTLLAYAATKGAIQNLTAGLAFQLWGRACVRLGSRFRILLRLFDRSSGFIRLAAMANRAISAIEFCRCRMIY